MGLSVFIMFLLISQKGVTPVCKHLLSLLQSVLAQCYNSRHLTTTQCWCQTQVFPIIQLDIQYLTKVLMNSCDDE